jgi:hypothetical protein
VGTSSPAAGDITARLQPLADRMFTLARPILKSARKFAGPSLSMMDARIEILASLFLTYIHLGGNPDLPDAFDWERQTKRLLWLSRIDLGRFLEGPGSDRYDSRRRGAVRRGTTTSIRWDAWTETAWMPGPSRRDLNEGELLKGEDVTGRASPAGMRETPQETAYHRRVLESLPGALEAILPPADYQLLSEHYLHGKSQAEMAGVEGVAVGGQHTPTNRSPKGREKRVLKRKRPETAINVALHRARRKARYGLGVFWCHLSHEVA